MNLDLAKKVVLITGGSSGLGYKAAEQFAEEGAAVAITYHVCKEKALKKAGLLRERFGIQAEAYNCDLADENSIKTVFNHVINDFGNIHVLINNAGWWPSAYVKDMPLQEWKSCIDVNLTGHFIFSRLLIEYLMQKKQPGKIVNIVSFAGFIGSTSGHSHYASAKAGLIAFTKSLAREVGRSNIHVNAVSPGMMYTDMTQQTLEDNEQCYLQRIPLGRIAQPEEVAGAVLFLASRQADYITGTTLDVSGGLLMH